MIYSHPNVDLNKQLPKNGLNPFINCGHLIFNTEMIKLLLTIPDIDINAKYNGYSPLMLALECDANKSELLLNDPRSIITKEVHFYFMISR